MPLRDHFHPPVDNIASWEGFHGQWPAMTVLALDRKLPPRFKAEPRVHLGAFAEIDVTTFELEEPPLLAPDAGGGTDQGGAATAVWAPPQPTLDIAAELPNEYEYEVRIYDTKRQRRLVAAVEFVSPANKDRPDHRRAFVGKCAALLHERVTVAIVDLVTTREANLYAELLEFIGQSDPALPDDPPALYAAACRWRRALDELRFKAWYHELALGRPLPTLPLWLTDTIVVPLELEASYEETCRVLRIP